MSCHLDPHTKDPLSENHSLLWFELKLPRLGLFFIQFLSANWGTASFGFWGLLLPRGLPTAPWLGSQAVQGSLPSKQWLV